MRPFTARDYPVLARWYRGHKKAIPPFSSLPAVGFIVDGVAAAFLYQTDGGIGLLENYIRNPNIDSASANQALDELTQVLLATSKELGLTKVIGLTKNARIVKRAKQNGMAHVGQYEMIVRDF